MEVDQEDDSWTGLDAQSATLRVTNNHGLALNVELDLTGDRGTTRDVASVLGSIEVNPGDFVDVDVDLEPFLEGDSPFARAAFVGVRADDPNTGRKLTSGVSPILYFHATEPGKLIAYNTNVLMTTFQGGDVGSLYDYTEGTDRILRYEPDESSENGGAEGANSVLDELHARQPPDVEGARQNSDTISSHESSSGYTQILCLELEIRTDDSGFENSQGVREDHWEDTDVNSTVPAVHQKVKVGALPFAFADSSGCFWFESETPTIEVDIQVQTRSSLTNGTYVRLHDGSGTATDGTPGTEYSQTITDVEFTTAIPEVVPIGSYGTRWTLFAALMKSLHRYSDDLPSDTHIHAADQYGCSTSTNCMSNCCDCTGNYNYANDVESASDPRESYIRFAHINCQASSHRKKFIAAHEYGHAYSFQVANLSGQTPASTTHNVTPSACFMQNLPGTFTAYANHTKEWSSISFREGLAHYISARVWNEKAADGLFYWDGPLGSWDNVHDLARWHETNTNPGGYLRNVCCAGLDESDCDDSVAGAGTIIDWMRGLWQLHADDCPDSPSRAEMADIAAQTMNYSGLTNQNFYDTLGLVVWLSYGSCYDDLLDIGQANGMEPD